jgi:hypothetical protein
MTEHIGFKVHVYPDEMDVLMKVFNRFDTTQLNEEEQIVFNNFVDAYKDQVLNY